MRELAGQLCDGQQGEEKKIGCSTFALTLTLTPDPSASRCCGTPLLSIRYLNGLGTGYRILFSQRLWVLRGKRLSSRTPPVF